AARAARRRIRRPRQLLHQERVPQSPPDRLQLRPRAPTWALPVAGGSAAAEGVAAQPPRQVAVRVRVLARTPSRSRDPRDWRTDADFRQAPGFGRRGVNMSTTTTLGAIDVELNEEGFFVHPEQWTQEMAPELARREGID